MALRVDNYLDESDRDNAFERTKVMTLIEIAETNNSQSIKRLKEIQDLYVIINEKNEEMDKLKKQNKELNTLKRKNDELNNTLLENNKKISSLDRKVFNLLEENKEKKQKIYCLEDTINVNDEEIEYLNNQINKINEGHKDSDKLLTNLIEYKNNMEVSWLGGKWGSLYQFIMS